MSSIYRTPKDRKKVFRKVEVIYRSRSIYDFEFPKGYSVLETSYYDDNREEFEALYERYAQALRDEYMAPVYLKWAGRGIGYGLFAAEEIPEGALISEYTGVVRESSDDPYIHGTILPRKRGYDTDYAWDYPEVELKKTVLEINALYEGNETRFVNHSFEPNLMADHLAMDNRWVLFFKTVKTVKKDQQLTVNYGEEYWNGGFRTLQLF